MKTELNTTEQFISEAECLYNHYMNKRLRNQSVYFYHLLKNKKDMNEVIENIIEKTKVYFYGTEGEQKAERISGSVNYVKVKQHLRQLWIVYKCVYR
ncbi:hypothetical protein OD218_004578 [Salmonella enterica]|uniref:Uncharacterized protein n=2 Tax=Salmonella enterica TaxID=28901 RepID=A0A5V4ZCX0_SALER|nr:hypothetical protein [Salmonella enterica]EAB9742142.1 hypothetical protein [Salmonella enterica subsp. diarizonae]EBE3719077.1 hypothetical protein [Salmonella enterica subsp. diarizonae serovar 42:l,v:1,5,7]ECH9564026.1 hypothetical protein [Salmonella enterica subsp. salamae]EDS4951333.1 hypothetical protein [Salmonella enterica subsp. enterica serovar Redlands]EDX2475665.1 hypothetical protein [Salmonella enterica subsp. diarizonae serovar 16:z10:e,n,x,z15]EEE1790513.1 hypothetical pro